MTHPSDPIHGPDRPWPGNPVPSTRPTRRLLLAAVLVFACTALTVGLAILSAALVGHQPLDFNSWLIAFVALSGLATSRAVPGPKRPARAARAASGTRVSTSGAQRFRLAARAGSPLAESPRTV